MLTPGLAVRRAEERGTTQTEWLLSRHCFSFDAYQDPARMGLEPLRVLNDDAVAPGQGFGPQAHRDTEILSYVLDGALRHEDSAGHAGVVKAGEAQFLSAGTGLVHSEMNASASAKLRFLQMWFMPRSQARKPAYQQAVVAFPEKGGWATVASPEGSGAGGFELDADAVVLAAKLAAGQKLGHVVHGGRMAYVFVPDGTVGAAGEKLLRGDAGLLKAGILGLKAQEPSHVLLLDLPLA